MTAELIIHSLIPGTPEWDAHRLNYDNASEAPAMLGLSKNLSRSDLVKAKATGVPREFSRFVQERVLDKGHEVEAKARPLVEEDTGEELYPVVCTRGTMGASCDGRTLGREPREFCFEHKQWNEELAAAVRAGTVPDYHMPQVQQILMVTGDEFVRFVVSDGTRARMAWVDVYPDADWWRRLVDGWALFHADVAKYKPAAPEVKTVATAIEQLPTLVATVKGEVVDSNLAAYVQAASAFIDNINTNLVTDQDFTDADAAIKFCDASEKRLEAVKEQALAQTATIDQLFKAVDTIKERFRQKRLQLKPLVADRKEARKGEIIAAGRADLADYRDQFKDRPCFQYMGEISADFGAAIKGLKTFKSMEDSVAVAATNAKMAANDLANRIDSNLRHLQSEHADRMALFPDLATLVGKQADDFKNLVSARVLASEAAEKKRAEEAAERERERIRREEAARVEREAQQRREQEARQLREQQESEARERRQREAAAAPAPGPAPVSYTL